MEQPARLLICDDDQNIHQRLKLLVEQEGGALYCSESGEQCLEMVEQVQPNLILVDVDKPSLSGLELCEEIKKNEKHRDIPIVFLSTKSTSEDIIKGYEAGAEDYITKPIQPEEVSIRVQRALNAGKRIQALEGQVGFLSQMAHNAMQEASYIGAVAHFATQTAFTKEFKELSESLMEVVERFNMRAKIITFSVFSGELHFSENGINDKEIQLMKSARSAYQKEKANNLNRIHTVKQYLISHVENATIMVKPLPEDEDQVGQIRDVMGHLSALYSTRILDIDRTKEMSSYIDTNSTVMHELEGNIEVLQSTFMDSNKGIIHMLDDLMLQFEKAIHELLLTEEQEKILFDILNSAIDHIGKSYVTSVDIDRSLKSVMKELKSIGNFKSARDV